MAELEIQVHVRRKWWVNLSMALFVCLYRATGFYPDCEKLAAFYAKHGFVYSLGN
jgi:hypothetical protein